MSDIKIFPVRQLETIFTEKCNLNCTYCFEKDKKQNKSMTLEDFSSFLDKDIPIVEFYPFGGEPFMNIEWVKDIIDMIEAKDMSPGHKEQLIHSMTFHITNGTLALKYLDIIKKYNLSLQISLDGPEDINDANRVYHDGKGSFTDVLDVANKLVEEGVYVSIHGAVSRTTLPDLFRIFRFHFDTMLKWHGMKDAIHMTGQNIFQVIFEDDFTDDDVDIFLGQMFKVCEWMMTTEDYDFSKSQREELFVNWLKRKGSACIAGNKMICADADFNVYPCHRLAMVSNREDFSLGSLKGPRNFKNFQLFNTFLQIDKDRSMYSSAQNNIEWKGDLPWVNWCPSANAESGTSVFHQHSKHNLMISELTTFVPEIAAFFGVDLNRYKGQSLQSSCMNNNQSMVNSNN